MRRKASKGLAILVLMSCWAVSPVPPAAADRERDHEALRAMMRTVKTAVNENRLDDILPLLAKDFSVTMVDQTLITEPGQLKEYFRKTFAAPDSILKSVRIEPEADILTGFLDDATGINRGTSTDTYTLKSGQQVVLKTRWSGTFRRIDDKWKIVNVHVGVNFLDNPVLQVARTAVYWWGAGGLLAGAAVGFAAAWLWRRPATRRV